MDTLDSTCKLCHNDALTGQGDIGDLTVEQRCTHCGALHPLPDDYETCGDCGFDHVYESEAAMMWHMENPCSYCNYNEDGEHELKCPTVCPISGKEQLT